MYTKLYGKNVWFAVRRWDAAHTVESETDRKPNEMFGSVSHSQHAHSNRQRQNCVLFMSINICNSVCLFVCFFVSFHFLISSLIQISMLMRCAWCFTKPQSQYLIYPNQWTNKTKRWWKSNSFIYGYYNMDNMKNEETKYKQTNTQKPREFVDIICLMITATVRMRPEMNTMFGTPWESIESRPSERQGPE